MDLGDGSRKLSEETEQASQSQIAVDDDQDTAKVKVDCRKQDMKSRR